MKASISGSCSANSGARTVLYKYGVPRVDADARYKNRSVLQIV